MTHLFTFADFVPIYYKKGALAPSLLEIFWDYLKKSKILHDFLYKKVDREG